MERAILGGEMSHYSIESPLSRYVREYVPTIGRTITRMTYYNGIRNPYEHVTQFERKIRLPGHDEITMCQIFKVYLKDGAQGWYHTFLPKSIRSYEHIRNRFLKHFNYNR